MVRGRKLPHTAQGDAGAAFRGDLWLGHIKDLSDVHMLCSVHSISRNGFHGSLQLYVQFYYPPGFYCNVIICNATTTKWKHPTVGGLVSCAASTDSCEMQWHGEGPVVYKVKNKPSHKTYHEQRTLTSSKHSLYTQRILEGCTRNGNNL